MKIDSFLKHHNLSANPFDAEEARHDKIFERMLDESPAHPDFPKILGRIDRPSTSVVFGEKGSGKTAIRLLIGKHVAEHNEENPKARTLIVAYDDLNPFLDRLIQRSRHHLPFYSSGGENKTLDLLKTVRLEDHQDAILSLGVTKLVDGLLDEQGSREPIQLPGTPQEAIGKLSRRDRADLAVMAALYDQPRSGVAVERFDDLIRKLRLGWRIPPVALKWSGLALLLIGLGFAAVWGVWWLIAQMAETIPPEWLLWTAGTLGILTAIIWLVWGVRYTMLWNLSRKISGEMPAIDRSTSDLVNMLDQTKRKDRLGQPFPVAGIGNRDARYKLTSRFTDILAKLGYSGVMVLVDRVDEPTLITGKAERMKAVIWPMFDNKFLQQENLGIKMLLPIELRHELFRESANFFQEARMDKQNMVDRLAWSGAVLYDLASSRLQAASQGEDGPTVLTDLFEETVTRESLIDALDQMDQPRDAFKFLYQVLQDHCKMVPDESEQFRIPRLVLETVRKQQSQRIQELYRGVTPA